MPPQSSTERATSQYDSTLREEIARRLRAERVRIEPQQRRFAATIGVTQGKLSTLETGNREAKAGDLAAMAMAGVDVTFVLTGERVETAGLGRQAAELVALFNVLDAGQQAAVLQVVTAMATAGSATLQAPRHTFRTENREKRDGEGAKRHP